MPDPTDPRARIAQLIGSHTADGHWDGPSPMSVHQVLGGRVVAEIAAMLADDTVAPLLAERDRLIAQAGREADRADQTIGLSQANAAAAVQLQRQRDAARAALEEISELVSENVIDDEDLYGVLVSVRRIIRDANDTERTTP